MPEKSSKYSIKRLDKARDVTSLLNSNGATLRFSPFRLWRVLSFFYSALIRSNVRGENNGDDNVDDSHSYFRSSRQLLVVVQFFNLSLDLSEFKKLFGLHPNVCGVAGKLELDLNSFSKNLMHTNFLTYITFRFGPAGL